MSGGRLTSIEDRPVTTLKLMVDKSRNRVIFAESDRGFVDTLFSFLTLPIGTVVRLIGRDSASIGSISRIYASVSSLEARCLQTAHCKTMLLIPRNASEAQCSKLKLNLNPSEPNKFYMCCAYSCPYETNPLLSTFEGVRCPCGWPMNSERTVSEENDLEDVDSDEQDGVFVKCGPGKFMITDDLQILPGSTAACIALLQKLGINDGNGIEERTVEIGKKEVLQLLKSSLLNKSPLTEAILLNQSSCMKNAVKFEYAKTVDKQAMAANSDGMTLTLLLSKSKKRVLFAEAGEDMVNFLFSFLAFPLGSVVELLEKNSRLGCMDNLYKSAEDLSCGNYITSEEHRKMLVSPKLAPYYGFDNHPLEMEETSYPKYVVDCNGKLMLITADGKADLRGFLTVMDPKSSKGETSTAKGYLKGPATFMITDNLTVTPLSPISSMNLFNQLKVPISDVEERAVPVGKDEALNLLKASLISKTALSDVFNRREPYPEFLLEV